MFFALIPIDRVVQEGQVVVSVAHVVTPNLRKETTIDDQSTAVDHLTATTIM